MNPSFARLTYSGMIIDCSGTIMAATTTRRTTVEARKRRVPSAYPAVVLTTRMIAIALPVMSVEFQSIRQTSSCWKRSCHEVSENPWPLSHWSYDRNDADPIDQNG